MKKFKLRLFSTILILSSLGIAKIHKNETTCASKFVKTTVSNFKYVNNNKNNSNNLTNNSRLYKQNNENDNGYIFLLNPVKNVSEYSRNKPTYSNKSNKTIMSNFKYTNYYNNLTNNSRLYKQNNKNDDRYTSLSNSSNTTVSDDYKNKINYASKYNKTTMSNYEYTNSNSIIDKLYLCKNNNENDTKVKDRLYFIENKNENNNKYTFLLNPSDSVLEFPIINIKVYKGEIKKKVLGEEQEVLDDQKETSGENKEVLDDQKETSGENKEVLDEQKGILGENKEVLDDQKEILGEKKEILNERIKLYNRFLYINTNKKHLFSFSISKNLLPYGVYDFRFYNDNFELIETFKNVEIDANFENKCITTNKNIAIIDLKKLSDWNYKEVYKYKND